MTSAEHIHTNRRVIAYDGPANGWAVREYRAPTTNEVIGYDAYELGGRGLSPKLTSEQAARGFAQLHGKCA